MWKILKRWLMNSEINYPHEISLEKVYDESYYFKEKFNTLYTSILFAILIVDRDKLFPFRF